MAQERSEAIVIRGVDFSETSRIVTFLTPERGKMACMATGVRRPNSPLAGMLDTFNRLEVVYYWKDGRSVQKLGEASLLDGYSGLKSSLDKGAFAAFPLEFAYKVAQENEPSQALYEVLRDGLKQLASWDGAARTQVTWLMLRLLSAAGFEPDLSSREAFDETATSRTSAGTFETLRLLSLDMMQCPIAGDEPSAFAAVRRYVVRHVESEFRSLRVIGQLFDR